MTVLQMLLVFIVVFLALAIIRVPLAHSMLGASMVSILLMGQSINIVASTAYSSIDVFAYLAIPGFVYAGNLMLHGRIAESILDEVTKLVRGSRKALGDFAVLMSMLFGTIMGSATATVALVGGMLFPRMEKMGYRREESAALIASAGILGVMIPPSIQGIMYAIAAGESIIHVWCSTIIPALILGPLWMLTSHIRCRTRLRNLDELSMEDAQMLREIMDNQGSRQFNPHSIPALLAPVILFAGIFGGIFTPTEAGAVVVAYSLIVGTLFYKGLNRKNLFEVTLSSAKTSAAIVILIAFSAVAGRMFTMVNMPTYLVNLIVGSNIGKVEFLIIMNLILLAVGMFMETNTSILILVPLVLPIAKSYGIDPVHFGSIMLMNLQIGMLSPPFAANLFVACKVAKCDFNKIIRPISVYILVSIPVLILVTFVPQVSLFLVNLFFR